ncbi:MAG: hypothetical protein KDB00_28025, partial [Planctomycetales bacterium]|nr:hypothetical protein [Planctomycetales bacterium]
MISRVKIQCLVALSALLMPFFAAAQQRSDDPPVVRELYVPFSDLDALLGSNTNRVFMSRQEFENLKAAAEKQPESQGPHAVAVVDADYEATIRDERAIMRGELAIDVRREGVHAVPLGFIGVTVRVATLDGTAARLAQDEAGNTLLFVDGIGQHNLVVELVMPVATDSAQQTLRFGVPVAPVCRMELSVPGNVEIIAGASVVRRDVDEAQNLTRFQITAMAGEMSITMSLNNRKTREENTVMARGVVVAEITEAYERLHATMSMNVVNGASDELRFVVDDGLDVDDVSCDLLSRWEIERVDGQNQLVVKLRVPLTERVVVNVRMDRGKPQFQDWHFPLFRPLKVAGYTAVVGLVAEDRLRVSNLVQQSLFSIDSKVLVDATATSMFANEPGAPRVQAVAAYYAASAEYKLTAQLKLPLPTMTVNASSLFVVSDNGVSVSGGLTMTPEFDQRFAMDFIVPNQWNLLWVRDGVTSDMRFDRHDDPQGTRIRVFFERGVTSQTAKTIWFKAEFVPPNWLSDWDTQQMVLPSFPVIGARRHEGVIAVQTEDDLSARATSADNLVVVSEGEKAQHQLKAIPTALAYRYDSPDWNATLALNRVAPRKTARVLNFIRVETESLRVHSELIFLVAEARSRTLQFSLDESTPDEIAISALGDVRIKETSSAIINGRRVWTVELSQRQAGSVSLAVDFLVLLQSEEPKNVLLPVVRAEAVSYQTGAIAIEGHPELETVVKQSPRTIDIGELVDAEYQVGKRLVGVFGYVADNDEVVVDLSRRPIHALPSTIVQRAEFVTHVSTQGRCQTAARYQLRTKATFLESRLPENSSLWSVMLDGKPSLPQRVGDRLMVAIPASTSVPIRDLHLVYESESAVIGMTGQVNVAAPQLFQRSDEDQGELIPVADLRWTLVLPNGYRVTHADAKVVRSGPSTSFLRQVVDLLSRLGGGTGHGMFAAIGAARESSAIYIDQYSDGSGDSHDFGGERLPPLLSTEEALGEVQRGQIKGRLESPPQAAASADSSVAKSEPQAQAGRKLSAQKGKISSANQAWALEGVRSLAIDLERFENGETINLTGLGTSTDATLTIVDQRRFDWIAAAAGLMVFLVGWFQSTLRKRSRFFFIVIVVAVLVPIVSGWDVPLRSVQTAVFVALFCLVVAYIVCELIRSSSRRLFEPKTDDFGSSGGHSGTGSAAGTANSITPVLVLFVSCFIAGPLSAQSPDPFGGAAKSVSSLDQLKTLIESIQNDQNARRSVTVPEDAVVVPYDSAKDDVLSARIASDGAAKLLVPYKVYQQLWSLAYPDEKVRTIAPPASYAWSDVSYQTTLDHSGVMQMIGTLRFEQLVDGDLAVPLRIAGCVIEKATVDGQPAKMTLVQPASPAGQAENSADADSAGLLTLHTSGKGVKEIEFRLRMRLSKSGGWQIVSGQVPSAPACALSIVVDNADTEVRLTGMMDRANYATSSEKESIETALSNSGVFSIRWRDRISEATIDQGLTAQTSAVFDIREDALRLAWKADFEFRRGRRESLSIVVPADYLV